MGGVHFVGARDGGVFIVAVEADRFNILAAGRQAAVLPDGQRRRVPVSLPRGVGLVRDDVSGAENGRGDLKRGDGDAFVQVDSVEIVAFPFAVGEVALHADPVAIAVAEALAGAGAAVVVGAAAVADVVAGEAVQSEAGSTRAAVLGHEAVRSLLGTGARVDDRRGARVNRLSGTRRPVGGAAVGDVEESETKAGESIDAKVQFTIPFRVAASEGDQCGLAADCKIGSVQQLRCDDNAASRVVDIDVADNGVRADGVDSIIEREHPLNLHVTGRKLATGSALDQEVGGLALVTRKRARVGVVSEPDSNVGIFEGGRAAALQHGRVVENGCGGAGSLLLDGVGVSVEDSKVERFGVAVLVSERKLERTRASGCVKVTVLHGAVFVTRLRACAGASTSSSVILDALLVDKVERVACVVGKSVDGKNVGQHKGVAPRARDIQRRARNVQLEEFARSFGVKVSPRVVVFAWGVLEIATFAAAVVLNANIGGGKVLSGEADGLGVEAARGSATVVENINVAIRADIDPVSLDQAVAGSRDDIVGAKGGGKETSAAFGRGRVELVAKSVHSRVSTIILVSSGIRLNT